MAALRWHQRQHGVVRHVLTAPTRRVSLREATSKRVSCNADSSLPIAFDSSFRRSFYLITAQLSPRWPKHAVNYVSHQKPTFFDQFVEIFVEDFCTSNTRDLWSHDWKRGKTYCYVKVREDGEVKRFDAVGTRQNLSVDFGCQDHFCSTLGTSFWRIEIVFGEPGEVIFLDFL